MPDMSTPHSNRDTFLFLRFFLLSSLVILNGCGGSGGNDEATPEPTEYSVTTSASVGGAISPASVISAKDQSVTFTITPNNGYRVDSISGCSGNLTNNTYITSPISEGCEVVVSFIPNFYQLTTSAGEHGSFNSSGSMVLGTARLTLIPDPGYVIDQVSGCGGSLQGLIYTTDVLTADCTVSASFKRGSTLGLAIEAIKTFSFNWIDTPGANYYKLFEDPDGESGFSQIGGDLSTGVEHYEHIVALYTRLNARYLLQVCYPEGCIDSNTVGVSGSLAEGIGYIKASNTNSGDWFGQEVKLSADGLTLAVATTLEESNATGINGDQNNNSLSYAGATYIFTRVDNQWSQQAYIKASNTESYDFFGISMDLSADGSTLAVGASGEDSISTSINGDESDNSGGRVGAAYIFTRTAGVWSQQAYIKASEAPPSNNQLGFGVSVALDASGSTLAVGSEWGRSSDTATGLAHIYIRSGSTWSEQQVLSASNSGYSDGFGLALALSDDGNTLAVGAPNEESATRSINGDQSDNSADHAGAVYIFNRSNDSWSQHAYIKASNASEGHYFGKEISLSGNGDFLAVGAHRESSSSMFDQFSSGLSWSGATYVFQLSNENWSQIGFLKASNTEQRDSFGFSTSFNFDGSLLAIGAPGEDSDAHGIGGDIQSNRAPSSGAVYIFQRSENNFQQMNYIKPKYAHENMGFGASVNIRADDGSLAVGATNEGSLELGIGGDHLNTSGLKSGAVFLY